MIPISDTPQAVVLHGRLKLLFRRQQIPRIAQRQYERVMSASPWLHEIQEDLARIFNMNASKRVRFGKLLDLADRVGQAIAPHAGCTDGCSACCHIAVNLSGAEAARIGAKIGRTPQKVADEYDWESDRARYYGVPCPFLKDSRCSIYEHRPAACRTHFTLDSDAFFCQTDIPPDESAVPNMDITSFWIVYVELCKQMDEPFGDIRMFFPPEHPAE